VRRWLLLGCTLLLTSCGGTTGARPSNHATSPAAARAQHMKIVVREWSTRLDAGDNAGLARLFTVPVLMTQGPYVFRLVTRAQVARWHSTLPCSGHIVSITITGRVATAVFRLGNRTTSRCDAPGTLAAARFTIVRGKIVAWQQVPVPPRAAAPVA
jgi:hypothetical protein